MKMHAITCVIILSTISLSHEGFLYGAPCSTRNTLEISTRGTRTPVIIQCVDITSSGCTDLSPYLGQIGRATTLYADHMLLTKMPMDVINAMPYLELLDLSGNNIRLFPRKVIARHENLRTLLMSDNHVFIPKVKPLFYSHSLSTLQLSGNKIRRLTSYTFKALPRLKVLYLDNNLLRKVLPEYFKPLENLKFLHLGNNKLHQVLPRRYLPTGIATVITKGNPCSVNNCTLLKY